MKITPKLKAAIRKYYKTKRLNDGWFLDSKTKQDCINDIDVAAKSGGYVCEIFPGLIIIYKDGESRVFQDHNWWVGCKMDYWTSGTYRKRKARKTNDNQREV